MIARRTFIKAAGLGLAAATLIGAPAMAAEPIKIGEINSYTRLPAFTEPYRKGWQLALEEINAAGGIDGRKIEVISRDDAGEPGNAVKIAQEMVTREEVVMLAGGFFSNVGLALADYAKQRQVLFLASEPLSDALVWSKGNRYTFRLRPSTYMQAAMLADEAAKLPAARWATISPNYAYGEDAVTAFKTILKERKPDVEFVEEQWPPLFKIDAGATARALEASKPEAIYNVTFGTDLAKFVREGELRGLFEDREVVSLLSGEPEYLDPLGAEAPEGWIVTGYPWYALEDPGNKAFIDAYREKWGAPPMTGSLVGYNMMLSIAALLREAESTDTETLVDTMKGLKVETPQGEITYRAADHQSTMGAWVGRTAVKDGKGVMVDWHYADGADYLPSPEEAAKMRPAE